MPERRIRLSQREAAILDIALAAFPQEPTIALLREELRLKQPRVQLSEIAALRQRLAWLIDD